MSAQAHAHAHIHTNQQTLAHTNATTEPHVRDKCDRRPDDPLAEATPESDQMETHRFGNDDDAATTRMCVERLR